MSGIQEGAAERQVQVRFVTKQAKYAVTDTPINVPVSLRRYALSEIVNHLLDTGILIRRPMACVVHRPTRVLKSHPSLCINVAWLVPYVVGFTC